MYNENYFSKKEGVLLREKTSAPKKLIVYGGSETHTQIY